MADIIEARPVEVLSQLNEARIRSNILLIGHLVCDRFMASQDSEDITPIEVRLNCRPQRGVKLEYVGDNRLGYIMEEEAVNNPPKLNGTYTLYALLPEAKESCRGVPKVYGVVRPEVEYYGVLLGRDTVESIAKDEFDIRDMYKVGQ